MKLTNITIGTPPVPADLEEEADVFIDGKRVGQARNLALDGDVLRGDFVLNDKADLSKPLTVKLVPVETVIELSIAIPREQRP